MKKTLKLIMKGILVIIILLLIAGVIYDMVLSRKVKKIYAQLGEEAPVLMEDGSAYRDLNKNGTLDTYEDMRASLEDRLNDLISRMNLEEKAGAMFVSMIGMTPRGDILDKPILSTDVMTVGMSLMLPSGKYKLILSDETKYKQLAVEIE